MHHRTPPFAPPTATESSATGRGTTAKPNLHRIASPDQTGSIPLYAGSAEGAPSEIWERSPRGEPWVRNVTIPTLTPVLPAPGTGNGVAIVVAPGGAFRALSVNNEGMAVARWFADHGIAAFVLKYRLEPTPADPGEYEALIEEFQRLFATGAVTPTDLVVPREAIFDAQTALRIVRTRAADWSVDPARVGMIGFSAGAMTAVAVAVESPSEARPDFVVPIYPSMHPVSVPVDAPPMFVALAADDPLFGAQGFGLIEAWKSAGCPVEFHLFERGGHGFGFRHQDVTSDRWPTALADWMHMHGWM